MTLFALLLYRYKLDEQLIDITDVPCGEYQLYIVVDPDNLIVEVNEDNNHLSMPLTYTQNTVDERSY